MMKLREKCEDGNSEGPGEGCCRKGCIYTIFAVTPGPLLTMAYNYWMMDPMDIGTEKDHVSRGWIVCKKERARRKRPTSSQHDYIFRFLLVVRADEDQLRTDFEVGVI